MTDPLAAALRALEAERVAPKPRSWRNPRRRYDDELEQARTDGQGDTE